MGIESWIPEPVPAGLQIMIAADIKRSFEEDGVLTLLPGRTVLVNNRVCEVSSAFQCDLSFSPTIPKGGKYFEACELTLLPTEDVAHAKYMEQRAYNSERREEEGVRGNSIKQRDGTYFRNPYVEWLKGKEEQDGAEVTKLRLEAFRQILRENPAIRAAMGDPDPDDQNLKLGEISIALDDEVRGEEITLPKVLTPDEKILQKAGFTIKKEWEIPIEVRRQLMSVYKTLNEWGLYPNRYRIGSYRQGDLESNWDIDFVEEELREGEQRPIWSFECVDNDGNKVFVKAVTDPNHKWAPLESKREMLFYQEVQPEILKEMEKAEINIALPKIEKASDDGQIIAISYIDGEDVSSHHFEIKAGFDMADAQTIHQFILKFHEKPLSWWNDNAPGFLKTFGDYFAEDPIEAKIMAYQKLFKDREEGNLHRFTELIGDQNVRKMRSMLDFGMRLFKLDLTKPKEEQVTFVNNNLNAGGFMKGKDGKIYVGDWQVGQITHPAIASAYYIESLWQNPEQYDQILKQTLEKFKDDELAREMLRYELVFLRLSGVAVRFYGGTLIDKNKSPEEKQHAVVARKELAKRMEEAIRLDGVWAEFYTDKDQWTRWSKVTH